MQPVVVLDLDVNERKLSLGHKQTTKNPWDKCLNIYAVDTVHELSIDSIGDKGATINLPDELSAIGTCSRYQSYKNAGVLLDHRSRTHFTGAVELLKLLIGPLKPLAVKTQVDFIGSAYALPKMLYIYHMVLENAKSQKRSARFEKLYELVF